MDKAVDSHFARVYVYVDDWSPSQVPRQYEFLEFGGQLYFEALLINWACNMDPGDDVKKLWLSGAIHARAKISMRW
ncbi:hypothetical protein PT974_04011 [Cladobotryum mycophilum]|uniref:Uncharacterized protein n=1 Tax=Cladobotryum mycophilum TaxID=491253 RepID=A0ABR0STZ8_9HYPO